MLPQAKYLPKKHLEDYVKHSMYTQMQINITRMYRKGAHDAS